jgi:hypothetical protein
MQNLAQDWVRLAEQAERNDQYRLAGYRAKAWECLSLAESVNDPERRADCQDVAESNGADQGRASGGV